MKRKIPLAQGADQSDIKHKKSKQFEGKNRCKKSLHFYGSIIRPRRPQNFTLPSSGIPKSEEFCATTKKQPRRQSGRPVGSVLTIEFEIEGQKFTALNGGPQFKFNGIDLVRCESRDPGRGGLFLGETDCGRRPGISVRLAQGQIRFVVADHSHRFD